MAEGDNRVVLIAVDASKQADEAFDSNTTMIHLRQL
jgi:hypothetical protein